MVLNRGVMWSDFNFKEDLSGYIKNRLKGSERVDGRRLIQQAWFAQTLHAPKGKKKKKQKKPGGGLNSLSPSPPLPLPTHPHTVRARRQARRQMHSSRWQGRVASAMILSHQCSGISTESFETPWQE